MRLIPGLLRTIILLDAVQGDHPAKADSIRKILSAAQTSGEYGVERMFIGSKDDVAQIQLKDKSGRVRARLP